MATTSNAARRKKTRFYVPLIAKHYTKLSFHTHHTKKANANPNRGMVVVFVQRTVPGVIVDVSNHGMDMETVETIEAIEGRIIELKQEHRDLDAAIGILVAAPVHDELQLKRLKKRKLLLKDQISFLEAQLTPDIPA